MSASDKRDILLWESDRWRANQGANEGTVDLVVVITRASPRSGTQLVCSSNIVMFIYFI